MNKERFHNALAMTLGYKQIVKNKYYNIIIDDNTDDPKVAIKNADGIVLLSFKLSEVKGIKLKAFEMSNNTGTDKELKIILDAVYQAYLKATTNIF